MKKCLENTYFDQIEWMCHTCCHAACAASKPKGESYRGRMLLFFLGQRRPVGCRGHSLLF